MNETKVWYKSRGVWGGIVTLVASVAGIAGVTITAEQQLELVNTLLLISPFVTSAIGGIMSLVGRLKAKYEIEKF